MVKRRQLQMVNELVAKVNEISLCTYSAPCAVFRIFFLKKVATSARMLRLHPLNGNFEL